VPISGLTALTAPTRLRLGGPLPRQQPDGPCPHPRADPERSPEIPLGEGAFQRPSPMGDQPQFPGVVPLPRSGWARVTEPCAAPGAPGARLAWLSPTPIAVRSGRINRFRERPQAALGGGTTPDSARVRRRGVFSSAPPPGLAPGGDIGGT